MSRPGSALLLLVLRKRLGIERDERDERATHQMNWKLSSCDH